MIGGLFMAFVAALALALLLARFSKNPARARGETATRSPALRPRVSPLALHELVVALLRSMKLRVIEQDDPARAIQRLVAVQPGPLRDARFLLRIEAEPPGDLVEPSAALELAEEARADGRAVGVLVTPYGFDHRGLAELEDIERVDGDRLRALFARHLPRRLAELERYQLGGSATEDFDDDDWDRADPHHGAQP